jgi:hypothetical protein
MRLRVMIWAGLVLIPLTALSQQPPTLTPDQALQRYRESKAATLRDDFGELGRYRAANAALKPPALSENRVVFFGTSKNIFPASPTSTVASEARPHRKC